MLFANGSSVELYTNNLIICFLTGDSWEFLQRSKDIILKIKLFVVLLQVSRFVYMKHAAVRIKEGNPLLTYSGHIGNGLLL